MPTLNQQNIIVVLGDLGAGSNFVKNVLLLSDEVDFPWRSQDRLDFIQKNVYPESLQKKYNDWIKFEYRLRAWKKYYNVDIADKFSDICTQEVCNLTQTKKIVFLSHWPDIVNQLKEMYSKINVVSLHAKTQKEIDWQVSQYISKIGINSLQNFTFSENIEQQKQKYIAEHGIKSYQQLNALNMREILYSRKDTYQSKNYINVDIAQLQNDSWITDVAKQLNINIDLTQAKKLSKIWKRLNPPYIEYWKTT